ncbi:MAG: hypothetical protein ACTSRA_18185, partial [Promethearchaeota archaeon]
SKWLGTSTIFMNFVLAPRGQELNKDDWVYGQYYGDWQGTGRKCEWEDVMEFFGPRGSIRFEPASDQKWSAKEWMDMWVEINGIKLIGEPKANKLFAYLDDDKGRCIERRTLTMRNDIEFSDGKYLDQLFILEDVKNCIESGGKKQPIINFSEGYKSFIVTKCAILSDASSREIWVPKYWPDPLLPP